MSIQERRPADNYGSVEQPYLEQPSRKCCKTKYRVRYFYSKGAFLVLLWTSLISATVLPFNDDLKTGYAEETAIIIQNTKYWYVLLVLLYVSIPLAGWLADRKFGNYTVFKAGSVLLFLSAIVRSTQIILRSFMEDADLTWKGIMLAVQIISCLIGLIGIAACLVTALQLGLDQMPDASADNITSFIAWFIFSIFTGFWMSTTLLTGIDPCVRQIDYIWIISCLMPPVCMAIVCCSMFTLAPRYLIVEPKSPNSLKIIYQVLKFATKHKAPLNCCAFTYWEEDIPSRLDLGKSKYGGPFSTEQVEDVKTFFKIMTIFVPLFLVLVAFDLTIIDSYLTTHQYISQLLFSFTFYLWWAIATVVYEFGVHPFIRNKIPSTLKRIGIVAVLILLINCSSFVLSTVNNFHFTNSTLPSDFSTFYYYYWPRINQVLSGIVALFLMAAVLEFVCAQSPYNMRGLLTGFATLITFSSISLSSLLKFVIPELQAYSIIHSSILTALSLVGFILHCVLGHWYKRRVRDEDYSPHRVVEEVYDRYLSHVH